MLKRWLFLIIINLFFVSVALAEPEKTLTEGLNTFTFELFQKIRKNDSNLIISPYSVSSVLNILALGAKDQTRKQMLEALHRKNLSDRDFVEQFNSLQQTMLPTTSCNNYFSCLIQNIWDRIASRTSLTIANAIWVQKNLSISSKFLNLVAQINNLELKPINFTQSSKAVSTINQWVSKKTQRKIPQLLSGSDVNNLTRLILTNAIYFKGLWEHSFPKKDTTQQPFILTNQKSINVPMMLQTEHFDYAENNLLQVLQLSYKKTNLAMLIVLPKTGHSLAEVSLNQNTFLQLLSQLKQEKISVSLPKFSIFSKYQLKNDLNRMGMIQPFTSAANFGGISSMPFAIDNVIQKAGIEVDEEGTVAYAATGVIMFASAYLNKSFIADHPFIFIIYDKKTTTILFIGQVMDPSS